MREHNLFKPKNIEEGKHAVVGDCNGFTMQQRWEAETPAFAKKIISLAGKFQNVTHPQILDYGCGVGRLARQILYSPGMSDIIGVDDSLDMLGQANKYVNNNRFTTLTPGSLYPYLNTKNIKYFDLAYCIYVLQHVPAVEIREILSRIHRHLKDDGIFIYCSSDYRMSIRFDGKGFFDDRFLGVDLQSEVERYFEKIEPLFNEEDYKNNPILRKMITGCDNGLAHPAFIYRKRILNKDPIEISLEKGIKAIKEVELTNLPKKLLLINRLSPGDILVMTNAIRDLHLAHPELEIDVRTPCPQIFENNPHITKLKYDEVEYCDTNAWFRSNTGKTKMIGDILAIDMQYPLIHRSGARGAHFAEGHREFLEETLGIKIPQTSIRPEIFLTDVEKSGLIRIQNDIKGKYWIINAGSKSDYTLKQYPYYQEVVNLLKDKIQFVQIGVKSHLHKPLDGVIDMVGKTNNMRDLFSLINNAEGVLTCVSLPMHVAAAFKKPCVVVAGAREGTRWELYPNHRFLYVNGCLPCADYDGCWRSKTADCIDKINGIPKCMTLILPEEVVHEIYKYYLGGILQIGDLEMKDKQEDPKKIINAKEAEGFDINIKAYGTSNNSKAIKYRPFPEGINTLQATSSIFNILRILKQLNPNDTYLEAYQWHFDKRKDKFMDIYHFLQWLGAYIHPKRILEIGTRTGISICQLLSAYLHYDKLEKVVLCDLFNDGLATPGVVLNALKYLNIPIDKVQFITGDSIIEIPKLILNDGPTFDYVLVDGCHDKLVAKQDLEHAKALLAKSGIIVFDDITQDGCSLQDVWDEFKYDNYRDFVFMENHEGKGIGVAVKIP